MAEHVELERATQEELRTDLRALFQGAIRLVIETALQEEVPSSSARGGSSG